MDTSRRRLCMAALAACALGQAGWRQAKAQAQAQTGAPADGVREIAVEARRFFYSPNRIAVKLGEQVIVAFTAIDFVHGFNVPELHVRADLMPGRSLAVGCVNANLVHRLQGYFSSQFRRLYSCEEIIFIS